MKRAWQTYPKYLYEAKTREGFLQYLAANLLPAGYWFYVSGWIPDGKDPAAVDRKLLDKYGIELSPSSRARRKRRGMANLHYLRFQQFFLLLATHGQHEFFADEAATIRDVRRVPIKFEGYSIRVVRGNYLAKAAPGEDPVPDGKWRVRVQIQRERFRDLKAYFLEIATRFPVEEIAQSFWGLPFEPYAPVRQQLWQLVRKVNNARLSQGLPRVPPTVIRYQRRILRPFGDVQERSEFET